MVPQDGSGGCALQIVQLNMEQRKVEVNQDALERLEKKLKEIGSHKLAVVSVMGAFRTGKSFLLDLFLRHLRYEKTAGASSTTHRPAPPERGTNELYPLPGWITEAGANIEGGSEGDTHGFRFKGGMDHCTEGIWVWSEPFVRRVNGKTIALLLMDTQGAWDSRMTKEQSATVFGLTAVLSSKQIYNINMQIQEDKVENLAYFMRFAQAALRSAARDGNGASERKPFQSLDFLVRDWANFEDDWSVARCKEQMNEHLEKHLDPKKVVENSTPEALHSMFERINCFCLPHPGTQIQKAKWSGAVKDIDLDFIRFVDEYLQDVFSTGCDVKTILGAELSTETFPYVLKNFVKAFQDATPVAMSFTEAMTNATVLLAKEKFMKLYTKKMEAAAKAPRGMEPKEFEKLHQTATVQLEREYQSTTILGSDEVRDSAWTDIQEQIQKLHSTLADNNERRLEKALVAFANLAILGMALFILDRASDWTCDWWLQTCRDVSSLMLLAYLGIFSYIGFFVWRLTSERGKMAAASAGAEMWKEMVRLMSVYGDLATKAIGMGGSIIPGASGETKKDK